ncbi:MAG: hypothetical protein U9R21_10020 [Candidatus Thermoplasmatota archaeon]|nr:hypothetical protein [Candidatus Thermoplasmatota archaeon]
MMASEMGFTKKVLKSFKNITKEIEKRSSEHDIRYRFVKYFAEEVLGYEPKYIKWEKKRADLTIVDENDFAVPKSDEVLKEIISKGSLDRSKIQEKIEKLERELNNIVYELYSLNRKEIDIIEESLK